MAEKKKHSDVLLASLGQLQSPSTAATKPRLIPHFSDVPRPNEEQGGIFEGCYQKIDCALGNDRYKRAFTWGFPLSQSSDIAAPRFWSQNGIFPR